MRPYSVYNSSGIEEDSSSNDGYISSGNDNVSSSVNARDSSDAIAAPTARETNSVHHANRRSNESVNIRNNEIYRRTSSGERSGGRSTTPHQEEDPVVAKLTDLATARYLFEERLEASENSNTSVSAFVQTAEPLPYLTSIDGPHSIYHIRNIEMVEQYLDRVPNANSLEISRIAAKHVLNEMSFIMLTREDLVYGKVGEYPVIHNNEVWQKWPIKKIFQAWRPAWLSIRVLQNP